MELSNVFDVLTVNIAAARFVEELRSKEADPECIADAERIVSQMLAFYLTESIDIPGAELCTLKLHGETADEDYAAMSLPTYGLVAWPMRRSGEERFIVMSQVGIDTLGYPCYKQDHVPPPCRMDEALYRFRQLLAANWEHGWARKFNDPAVQAVLFAAGLGNFSATTQTRPGRYDQQTGVRTNYPLLMAKVVQVLGRGTFEISVDFRKHSPMSFLRGVEMKLCRQGSAFVSNCFTGPVNSPTHFIEPFARMLQLYA